MKKMKRVLFAVTLLAVLSMVIAPAAAQITWSSDIRLTDDPAGSISPSIAMDSAGNIHIAWHDKRDGNWEIYYTKLDNNGNTLVDDTRLTDDPSISYTLYCIGRVIAIDSNNNIHITWYDGRDGNKEIYYTKLDNNGNTLVDDTRLTDAPRSSNYPSITVDSSINNIHIAWEDTRHGSRNSEIYYTKLDNNGNTLVDDTRLTDDPAYSKKPAIAADSNNNIHIVWYDKRDGNYEIYYTKLDNNGNTLVDDTRLTYDPAYSYNSYIAADSSNNVHITWREKRDGNYEIYYTKLDNNGATLVDDTRLTDDPSYSYYPVIAADSNNNMHITWYDKRDGNWEIYYTELDNIGTTLVDDTRLTDDPAKSQYPKIAVDSSNNIHIAWYDKRDGNSEIYYKKGSVPPPPPKPDLKPTAITTPELLFVNQPSVVNATIANIGTDDAGSFNVSLSADGNVVDTASVESLGVGNATNVSFQWTPASAGEVDDLCVAADSDGSVDELSETNNDKCVVVWVHAPDLVPTAITPDAFFPGKPNTVTATVENMGDADAGSFDVALSANGDVVDTAGVASLGIGDTVDVSFSWTATVGDHELCVLADSDSEVEEGDETNNELCKDVTVYPNTVYLVPKDSGAPYCCEAEVEVWVKAEDGFQGGQINLTYSLDCANVTGVEFNPVWDFESATWWDTYEGYTRISFAKNEGMVSEDIRIGNLMIQCTSEDIDTLCSTTLGYATTTKLVNDFGTEVKANLIEGTFGCDLAEVRIEPETSNLGSKGNFTAFVTLPELYDVADINVSTVECEGAPVVESEIVHGGDTLMVKFNRQKLVGVPTGDAVTMRVTGKMQTGKIFVGRDTICVIKEGQ